MALPAAASHATPDGQGAPDDALVATVTLSPGRSPAELAADLAALPAEFVFVEAFGDLSPVLVFGRAGVALPRRAVEAAVVATLTGWDG
ncbi:hypothetical protein I6A84_02035 [Frankia sp. CNm7]|nr:hypothetical protein [Frankia nepalensis]